MPDAFRRPLHRRVLAILNQLDGDFLSHSFCYFGGGTRIVMDLDEYRESRDIDLMCADRGGYRQLREAVSETSLGKIARKVPRLAREVRADQYGVRTWIAGEDGGIKFEIVRESRIDLAGESVPGIPVPCLSRPSAFAEKFLANADRGLDRSTLSRDLVDLAFMLEGWDQASAKSGHAKAIEAYGADIGRKVSGALKLWAGDKAYRARCIESMAIEDSRSLAKGLKALVDYAT